MATDQIRLPTHLKAIAWLILIGGVLGVVASVMAFLGVSGLEHRARLGSLILSAYAFVGARDILRGKRSGLDELLFSNGVLLAILLFFVGRDLWRGESLDKLGNPKVVLALSTLVGLSAYLLWCRVRWRRAVGVGGESTDAFSQTVSADLLLTEPIEIDTERAAHTVGAIAQTEVHVGEADGCVVMIAGEVKCTLSWSAGLSFDLESLEAMTALQEDEELAEFARGGLDGRIFAIAEATGDPASLLDQLEPFVASFEVECDHDNAPQLAARLIQAVVKRFAPEGAIVVGKDRILAWRDGLDLADERLLVVTAD